ncbi:MAG: NAD(P)H-dependent oxidoreductase subunit E [Actinomycetota bacterium]
MDLHLLDASPSDAERAAVDEVLGPPESGWHGGERRIELEGHVGYGGRQAREQRHLLLPALRAVQRRAGWISRGALNYICQRLTVPPAEAYGVASFYAMFSLEPRPPRVVHVCDDIACKTAGADGICADLERTVGPPGAPSGDGSFTWLRSPCLGRCEHAPAAMFQHAGEDAHDWSLAPLTSEAVVRIMEGEPWTHPEQPSIPQTETPEGRNGLRLLRRIAEGIDPGSLDDYRAHGGYEALRRAVDLGPVGVIREVTDSKLMGRGGAAFPTGVKWEAVAKQPVRPHYFICNADESEPGTFKDRVIMEQDPFAIVESMTIAGYATASEKGFLYIRGEYPLALRRMQHAIEEARARGLLGDDVMGERFRFDIEIRSGAGAYICGEETSLFNSIEGKRGEPRNKPPFPVEVGVFGKPTGINNVETLINVLDIVREGGPAFAAIGTGESTGPRLFCLSGCVARPGLYEVQFGTTLRELLRLAGGVRGGRELQTVLLGGAAGGFVTPDDLDMPLTFEATRAAGATLGSGVVMVFDETVDLVTILLRIAAFFRDESCGQCVPCRVGTVRQEEALHRLANAHARGARQEEIALIDEIGQVMRDASICGLGQTASSAVQSAIARLGVFGGTGSA